jgi:phage virion morphogenesis protein
MTGFAIKIQHSAAIGAMFQVPADRARDLSPAMKSIGEYMVREREKLFTGEHAPDGTPWQPLKIRTLYSGFSKKKYTKKGAVTKAFNRYLTGKKILTKDHHLRRTVYRAGTDSVTVSPDKTSQDYALIHQKGGKAGRNHAATIPAREHLGLNNENRVEIGHMVMDYITGGR